MDPDNPAYILIDMGHFEFSIEDMKKIQSIEYSYSSIDMEFDDL